MAVPTAAPAAAIPAPPNRAVRPRIRAGAWPVARGSGVTGEPLQRPAPRGVERRHLARDVGERQVPELIDDRVHLGAGAHIGIFLTAIAWPIEVALALAPARQQPLAVEPGHDRHIG